MSPSMEKMVTIRPNTERYIDEIREEKQRRRQVERQRQKSGLEVTPSDGLETEASCQQPP